VLIWRRGPWSWSCSFAMRRSMSAGPALMRAWWRFSVGRSNGVGEVRGEELVVLIFQAPAVGGEFRQLIGALVEGLLDFSGEPGVLGVTAHVPESPSAVAACSRGRVGSACTTQLFSYNINDMSERETINGKPVTEEQIAAWSAEAEVGYDVAALKKRGRGRPGRGAEPSQVIALRLTADEISALDARAEREGKSRSEVIREALASA
jgi:hypothetical protein